MPASAERIRPREVLVTVEGDDAGVSRAIASDFGLLLQSRTPSRLLGASVVRLRIPDARTEAAVLAALGQDPRIRTAQPALIYSLQQDRATGPGTGLPQYMLASVSATEAHTQTRGRGARIAIIDTGIDTTHPDLTGTVVQRFDAVGDGGTDTGAHGTAIASLIAADGGASGGLTGIAPDAALYSARAFAVPAAGTAAAPDSDTLILIRALDWCAEIKAHIVNMSLTGPDDPLLGAAVAALTELGTLVVAAAGNDGPAAPPAFPAAWPGVLAVTAIDDRDRVMEKANRGPYVALAAPGVNVLVARPGAGYDAESGTSMAAAVASASAALVLSLAPGSRGGALSAALTRSAVDLAPAGRDEATGAGRINAAAALAGVAPAP